MNTTDQGVDMNQTSEDKGFAQQAYEIIKTALGHFLDARGIDLTPSHADKFPNTDFYLKIEPGYHIAVYCDPVWHHGIYISRNEVIRFSGDTPATATINKTTVHDFVNSTPSNEFCIVNYDNDNAEFNVQTVLVAKEFLKFYEENEDIRPQLYRFLSSNCECFATFCKTGQWRYSTSCLPIINYNLQTSHKGCFKFNVTDRNRVEKYAMNY